MDRLSLHDRVWLEQLWLKAQQAPPSQWVRWSMMGRGQSVHLGFLPPQRAQWLKAHLKPMPLWHDNQWLWPAGEINGKQRSQWLGEMLHIAKQQQRIRGWRDELYAWWRHPGMPPTHGQQPDFVAERAGFRHLGLLSHAVHIHGFLLHGDLWCGQRAMTKATDPGLLDNLAAGGLPAGESPVQAAIRELHEEAGLKIDASRLIYKGSVRTCREEAEGWHDERLLVFNLTLRSEELPRNLDGEVSGFECLTPKQWLDRLRQGMFTRDAAAALACGLRLTPAWIG